MTVRRPDGRTARRAAGVLGAVVSLLAVWPSGRLPAQQQTSLTIYNDGRLLVRRTLPVPVPKGTSTHRLALGPLEASTLFSVDPAVALIEARYDSDVSEQSVLRRSVGKRFEFHTGYPFGPLTATLLGVEPERWRLDDGSIVFYRPGQLRYTEDMAVTQPTVELRIHAADASKTLALAYFTSGASWQVSYNVVLDAGKARVEGTAAIPVQRIQFDSAEVQLLAGSVRGVAGLPVREMVVTGAVSAEDRLAARAAPVATEERVGEVHVYSLPGRWSLAPGTTSVLPLFEPATTGVSREYVVRRPQLFYGIEQEPGEGADIPVAIHYTLDRRRGSAFGDRPVPAGAVRIFERDRERRLQLVGEAIVQHTPAGKELELRAGAAFDLTARRRQTEYTTERDSSAAGVRIRATAGYDVALTNARDSAVTVSVYEQRAGEWSVIASSVPPEKVSATVARFRVAVPARGSATLTYRIRAVW
ncbi:MAG TPA: hypothetical protein VFU46_12425 [Gemmatimonadales bacterium]|nr:hypothetical protein [Gemmatimonadales bacterium]